MGKSPRPKKPRIIVGIYGHSKNPGGDYLIWDIAPNCSTGELEDEFFVTVCHIDGSNPETKLRRWKDINAYVEIAETSYKGPRYFLKRIVTRLEALKILAELEERLTREGNPAPPLRIISGRP